MRIILLVFLLIVLLAACVEDKEVVKKHDCVYKVYYGDWFSGTTYYCDTYIKKDRSYSLYCYGKWVDEIVVSGNYKFIIRRNKDER